MVEVIGVASASDVHPFFFSVKMGECDILLHKNIKKTLQSTA